MPLFSVITVCLNDIEGLKKTADSLKSQDFEDFEWIVVDGGSHDGTIEYLEKEKAIDHYLSDKDNGIYDAMNKGIGLATGDYCLFLNAGDYLCDTHVLSRVSAQSAGAALVIGRILVFDPELDSYERKSFDSLGIGFKSLYSRTLPHQSSFFKKDLFEQFGLYDTSFKVLADHDFFARIIKQGVRPEFVDIDIAVFIRGGISSTLKGSNLFEKELNKVRIKNYSYIYRLFQETVGMAKRNVRNMFK